MAIQTGELHTASNVVIFASVDFVTTRKYAVQIIIIRTHKGATEHEGMEILQQHMLVACFMVRPIYNLEELLVVKGCVGLRAEKFCP